MKSQNLTDGNLSDAQTEQDSAANQAARKPATENAAQDVVTEVAVSDSAASGTRKLRSRTTQDTTASRSSQAKIVASWALVAGMLVFIFAMSAQTGSQLDEGDGPFSQIKRALAQQALALTGHEVDVSPIGHFSEYFALGIVLMNALCLHVRGGLGPNDGKRYDEGRSFRSSSQNSSAARDTIGRALLGRLSLRLPLLTMALASLYGISDEFHQIFVPQRSCDPADWAVDTIAALIGALICYALVKRTAAQHESDR